MNNQSGMNTQQDDRMMLEEKMSRHTKGDIEPLIANLDELSKAIIISVFAHGVRGQKEKTESIYSLHPLRVMLSQKSMTAMAVGVLHDVVEDCNVKYGDDREWTIERLRKLGISEEVLSALTLVSKADSANESYLTFCARAALGNASRLVKIADLEDNMNIRRLTHISQKDSDRLDKYLYAYNHIKKIEIIAWSFDYQVPTAVRVSHEAKLSQALYTLIPPENMNNYVSKNGFEEEDQDDRVAGHYYECLDDAEAVLPESAQVIEGFDEDTDHPFTEWHSEHYFYAAKIKLVDQDYGTLLRISYDDNWERWEISCEVLAKLHEDCDNFGGFLMRFFASVALRSAGNGGWANFLKGWARS